MDVETALIVACPAADAVVGDQRKRLDRAAHAGVPAHLTVAYPFKADLVTKDHRRLTELFLAFHEFAVRGERTGWFDHAVVFVVPEDPGSLIALTEAVQEAFPAYPIYGGAFDEVVPHVTIGHDQTMDVLQAAERVVLDRLPFRQLVDHVELWSGPPLPMAPEGSWRHARDYALCPPS
ncbi:MAG TPA: 2'-5' RNA ligase family protein [Dermatophilaceae bacterium]|nr:2'-5' RNA ligase family protein [Dermatophilaceae bacterium]